MRNESIWNSVSIIKLLISYCFKFPFLLNLTGLFLNFDLLNCYNVVFLCLVIIFFFYQALMYPIFLVDSCVPGDLVTISGTVKVQATDEGRGKQKDKCMFLLYINANCVTNSKGNKSSSTNNSNSNSALAAVEFTMKELYAIEEIQSEKNLFKLMVG